MPKKKAKNPIDFNPDPEPTDEDKETMVKLHPSEYRLIQYIRKIKWGEITEIKIQNGLPVLIKVAYKTLKL